MKKLAIALVLVVSAATGLAQCKTDRVSVHKEASMASSVIIGTVTAASPCPGSVGLSGRRELHRKDRFEDARQGPRE